MTLHGIPLERRTLHGHFSRELEPVLTLRVTQIVSGVKGVHAVLLDNALR